MNTHKVLLWAAKLSGLLITVLFVVLITDSGVPETVKGEGAGIVTFLPLLAVAFLGYFIAWFKPVLGGRIVILGGIIMIIYFLIFDDYYMMLVYGLPPIIIGLGFIAAGNKSLV